MISLLFLLSFFESFYINLFQTVSLDFIHYFNVHDNWLSYFMISYSCGVIFSCFIVYFFLHGIRYKPCIQFFMIIHLLLCGAQFFDLPIWGFLIIRFFLGVTTLSILGPLFVYEQSEENPFKQQFHLTIYHICASLGILAGVLLPGIIKLATDTQNNSYPFVNWILSLIIFIFCYSSLFFLISIYIKKTPKQLTQLEIIQASVRREQLVGSLSERHLESTTIPWKSIINLLIIQSVRHLNDSYVGSVYLLELYNNYHISTEYISVIYGSISICVIIASICFVRIILKITKPRNINIVIHLSILITYGIIVPIDNIVCRILFLSINLFMNFMIGIWADNQLFSIISKSVEHKVSAIKVVIVHMSLIFGSGIGTYLYTETSFRISMILPILGFFISFLVQIVVYRNG